MITSKSSWLETDFTTRSAYRKIALSARTERMETVRRHQITWLNCGALYIGETGRVLSIPIKEHLASKRRGSLVSAVGKHRQEGHNGNDFDLMCTILIHETDITARKALEGFWISARNPSMNNRNECVSVTNDFLPFVSLCEL